MKFSWLFLRNNRNLILGKVSLSYYSQPKLAPKTPERCHFNFNNKDTRTAPMTSFWCLYCYLGTDFILCSAVSVADFEQVKAS